LSTSSQDEHKGQAQNNLFHGIPSNKNNPLRGQPLTASQGCQRAFWQAFYGQCTETSFQEKIVYYKNYQGFRCIRPPRRFANDQPVSFAVNGSGRSLRRAGAQGKPAGAGGGVHNAGAGGPKPPVSVGRALAGAVVSQEPGAAPVATAYGTGPAIPSSRGCFPGPGPPARRIVRRRDRGP